MNKNPKDDERAIIYASLHILLCQSTILSNSVKKFIKSKSWPD